MLPPGHARATIAVPMLIVPEQLIDFYRRLPRWAQIALWPLLVLEAACVVLAERDIHRRPAAEIRGPKLLWRIIATQNVVGPAAYYLLGRR